MLSNAPIVAPSAVPARRCHDAVKVGLSFACKTTNVVIQAQYGSGSLKRRASASDAIAAIAFRLTCTNTCCCIHRGRVTGGIFPPAALQGESIGHAEGS